MKWRIQVLFVLAINFVGCQKEKDEVYLRDYLNDNGITASFAGDFEGNWIDNSIVLPLYESYIESTISNSEGEQDIFIRRYSDDFQSKIVFHLIVSDTGELLLKYCDCLVFLKNNNTISRVVGGASGDSLIINNYSYNMNTGKLTFAFQFSYSNESMNYNASGKVETILFEYIK